MLSCHIRIFMRTDSENPEYFLTSEKRKKEFIESPNSFLILEKHKSQFISTAQF